MTAGMSLAFESVEPFGKQNEKPLFADRNLKVLKLAVIGKNKNVIKLLVRNQYEVNGCPVYPSRNVLK